MKVMLYRYIWTLSCHDDDARVCTAKSTSVFYWTFKELRGDQRKASKQESQMWIYDGNNC